MQPVECSGCEEPRDRDTAALHHDSPKSSLREPGEEPGDIESAARARQAQNRGRAVPVRTRRVLGAEQQRFRPVLENAVAITELAVRVDHDTHRRWAFDLPGREL